MTNTGHKIKVSVGIAAYNAEKNISNMLNQILHQELAGFELIEIIIHSDVCTDKTNEIVKSFTDTRIKLITSIERKGFVGSLLTIFNNFNGDILVTFNDDIKIEDNHLIQKLVEPFVTDPKVGMVGGNTRPIQGKTFIEKAIESTFNAYEKNEMTRKAGNNIHGVDGKIMVFSRKALETFQYPKDLKQMGNVDGYLYFETLRNGYSYKQVRNAIVYYRNPSTIKDYLNWTTRNNASIIVLESMFGEKIVQEEYKDDKLQLIKYFLIEFLKNPFGCLFIFVMRFYIKIKAKSMSKKFESHWDIIETSKLLK